MAVVRAPSGGRGLSANPNQQTGGLSSLADSALNSYVASRKLANEEARALKEDARRDKEHELAVKREERLGEVAEMQAEKYQHDLDVARGNQERLEEARDSTENILGMLASEQITAEEAMQLGAQSGPETADMIYQALSPSINWKNLEANLRGQNLSNTNMEETMAHNRNMRPLQEASAREDLLTSQSNRIIAEFEKTMAQKKWGQMEQLNKSNIDIISKIFNNEVPAEEGVMALAANAFANGEPEDIKKVFDMNTFVVPFVAKDLAVMQTINTEVGKSDVHDYPVVFAQIVKSALHSKDPITIQAIQRQTGMTNTQVNQAISWLDSLQRKPQERNADAYSDWMSFADENLSPMAFPEIVSRMETSKKIVDELLARSRKTTSSHSYTQEEEYDRDEDGNLLGKNIVRTPGSKGSKSTKPTAPSIDDTALFEGQPGDE